MDDFLGAALGASASSLHVQFAAFLVIGVAVSWLLGRMHPRTGLSPALAIMGVGGAWLGAEVSCLFGQAQRGGAVALAAGLLGALALACAWRRYHPEGAEGSRHIAVRRISA
jgi:uncharacterized membrane protein YeaQ/YmgE (transglycosylase-associated protein family)